MSKSKVVSFTSNAITIGSVLAEASHAVQTILDAKPTVEARKAATKVLQKDAGMLVAFLYQQGHDTKRSLDAEIPKVVAHIYGPKLAAEMSRPAKERKLSDREAETVRTVGVRFSEAKAIMLHYSTAAKDILDTAGAAVSKLRSKLLAERKDAKPVTVADCWALARKLDARGRGELISILQSGKFEPSMFDFNMDTVLASAEAEQDGE